MTETLTREQIEEIRATCAVHGHSIFDPEKISALCDLALSAANAEKRGFAEAVEKAVEVVTGLRDKWCKPTGTKEEEAAWDQCQRIYFAIRALAWLKAQQRPTLHKYQPCGCVVCTCENAEQCQGCGAKHCGTHPIGKIPNPIYITSLQEPV